MTTTQLRDLDLDVAGDAGDGQAWRDAVRAQVNAAVRATDRAGWLVSLALTGEPINPPATRARARAVLADAATRIAALAALIDNTEQEPEMPNTTTATVLAPGVASAPATNPLSAAVMPGVTEAPTGGRWYRHAPVTYPEFDNNPTPACMECNTAWPCKEWKNQ